MRRPPLTNDVSRRDTLGDGFHPHLPTPPNVFTIAVHPTTESRSAVAKTLHPRTLARRADVCVGDARVACGVRNKGKSTLDDEDEPMRSVDALGDY